MKTMIDGTLFYQISQTTYVDITTPNGLFSRTTWVSQHQKGRSGFYWSKRWWGDSDISWTICKSFAPCSRQI